MEGGHKAVPLGEAAVPPPLGQQAGEQCVMQLAGRVHHLLRQQLRVWTQLLQGRPAISAWQSIYMARQLPRRADYEFEADVQ
jgi:hypothetical protein